MLIAPLSLLQRESVDAILKVVLSGRFSNKKFRILAQTASMMAVGESLESTTGLHLKKDFAFGNAVDLGSLFLAVKVGCSEHGSPLICDILCKALKLGIV